MADVSTIREEMVVLAREVLDHKTRSYVQAAADISVYLLVLHEERDVLAARLRGRAESCRRRVAGVDLPCPRRLLEHRGGVVGRANVVDVISGPIDLARAVRDGVVAPSQAAWYMGGFALVLDDVRSVPFVECRGALGLFGLPPDVEARCLPHEGKP